MINVGGKPSKQDSGSSAKVSDLLNNMNKQKTYFEMITGKSGKNAADETQAASRNGEKIAAGIEGSNLK